MAEKGRTSATDGVPLAQPALALAAKLVARAERAGLAVSPAPTGEVGQRLFAVVREAVAAGVDPESALRETARAYRAAMLAAEESTPSRLSSTRARVREDRGMTMPDLPTPPERAEPPLTGDERATLAGFLDYYRATLALKCRRAHS